MEKSDILTLEILGSDLEGEIVLRLDDCHRLLLAMTCRRYFAKLHKKFRVPSYLISNSISRLGSIDLLTFFLTIGWTFTDYLIPDAISEGQVGFLRHFTIEEDLENQVMLIFRYKNWAVEAKRSSVSYTLGSTGNEELYSLFKGKEKTLHWVFFSEAAQYGHMNFLRKEEILGAKWNDDIVGNVAYSAAQNAQLEVLDFLIAERGFGFDHSLSGWNHDFSVAATMTVFPKKPKFYLPTLKWMENRGQIMNDSYFMDFAFTICTFDAVEYLDTKYGLLAEYDDSSLGGILVSCLRKINFKIVEYLLAKRPLIVRHINPNFLKDIVGQNARKEIWELILSNSPKNELLDILQVLRGGGVVPNRETFPAIQYSGCSVLEDIPKSIYDSEPPAGIAKSPKWYNIVRFLIDWNVVPPFAPLITNFKDTNFIVDLLDAFCEKFGDLVHKADLYLAVIQRGKSNLDRINLLKHLIPLRVEKIVQNPEEPIKEKFLLKFLDLAILKKEEQEELYQWLLVNCTNLVVKIPEPSKLENDLEFDLFS